MSINLQNDRLQALREANLTPLALLDKRNPHELNVIDLPSKIKDKAARAAMRQSLKKTDLASMPPLETTDMLAMVQNHQVKKFDNEVHARGVHRQHLDEFVDGMDTERKYQLADRIQSKIDEITAQVQERFRKKKHELDEQGVFHPAANRRRVESMCAVELQKKLNIAKIRDSVIRDMIKEFTGQTQVKEVKSTFATKLNARIRTKQQADLRKNKLRQAARLFSTKTGSKRRAHTAVAALMGKKKTNLFDLSKLAEMKGIHDVESSESSDHMWYKHLHIASVIQSMRPEDPPRLVRNRRGSQVNLKPAVAQERKEQRSSLSCMISNHTNEKLLTRLLIKCFDIMKDMPNHRSKLKKDIVFDDMLNVTKDEEDLEAKIENISVRKERSEEKYRKRQLAIAKRRKVRVVSQPVEDETRPMTTDAAAVAVVDIPVQSVEPRPSTVSQSAMRFPLCDPSKDSGGDFVSKLRTSEQAKRRKAARIRVESTNLWDWHEDWLKDRVKSVPEDTTEGFIPEKEQETCETTSSELLLTTKRTPSRNHRLRKVKSLTMEPLQRRIETIWTCLGTPYSKKLEMLASFSETTDPADLFRQIEHWERLSRLLAIQEKMNQCLHQVTNGCVFIPQALQVQKDELDFISTSCNYSVPDPPRVEHMNTNALKQWLESNLAHITRRSSAESHLVSAFRSN